MAISVSQCLNLLIVADPNDDMSSEVSMEQISQAFRGLDGPIAKMETCVIPMAAEKIDEKKMDDENYPLDDLALKFVFNATKHQYPLRKSFWVWAKKIIDGAIGDASTAVKRENSRYLILLEILVRLSMESGEKLRQLLYRRSGNISNARVYEARLTELTMYTRFNGMMVQLENGNPLGQSIKKFLQQPVVINAVIKVVDRILGSASRGSEDGFKVSAQCLNIYTSNLSGELPVKAIVVRDGFLIFRRDICEDGLMATCAVFAANLFANYMVMQLSGKNYLTEFIGLESNPTLMDNQMTAKEHWIPTSPGGIVEEIIFGRQINISLADKKFREEFEKLLLSDKLDRFPDDILAQIRPRSCPMYNWPALENPILKWH